ncbi:MAG: oxygen-independent coproporphyrinogen III oxidase [Methyloligellaceae bacterium]
MELYKKDQSLPRYTSYPTAPHFHNGVSVEEYSGWLSQLDPEDTLSLYLHIPFCDTLCWFCGCHTKITQRYDPVSKYIRSLLQEIKLVAPALKGRPLVTNIHFGGGSPTILTSNDFDLISMTLRDNFNFSDQVDFAVEIDPRGLTDKQIQSLSNLGVTRASIGVQDFNPEVQAAINRIQSFEETFRVITSLRKNGVNAINIDLLYGLPFQTKDTLSQTIDQVLKLSPDRISLFGYAHVPWMKKHQNLINDNNLPDLTERIKQADHCSQVLQDAGYIKIGMDHFAHPADTLAQAAETGTLRRNFQGYTTDSATAIIGMGASAISKLPQGYIQNKTAIGQYQSDISNQKLPVSRGLALTDEDKLRAYIIEMLMCSFRFSESRIKMKFGKLADSAIQDARMLMQIDNKNFTEPTSDGFTVTETGRPYIRIICAHFDKYLTENKARHSLAV